MTTEMFNVSPAATQSGSRIRKTVTRGLLVAAMTGGLAFGMAMPAFAAPGDTTTTFSVTAGAMSITVQDTAALTAVGTGATSVTGSLGIVNISDMRGTIAPWVVTVSSTTFAPVTANESSVSTAISYNAGVSTFTGTVAIPAGAATPLTAVAATVLTPTSQNGINTASFTPAIAITLPITAVAGPYTGTVTTSIA